MSADQNIPMWKPKDITEWLKSGDIQKDLIIGPHTIEFKEIEEYDAPNEEEFLIEEDKTLTVLKKYTRYIPKGKLVIKLLPEDFSDISNVAWRILGTDYWRPSLYVEEKILVGEYEIEFKDSQFCKAREPLVVTITDKEVTEIEYTFFTTGTPTTIKEEPYISSNTFIELKKRIAPSVINVEIIGGEGVIDNSVIVGKYGEPLEIYLQGSYVFNYETLMNKITSTVPIKFKFPHKIVTEPLFDNGSITFDIDWFNDIKEDFHYDANTISKGRQVGGIFTREEPYVSAVLPTSLEKRVVLRTATIKEDLYVSSNNITNNTKRQFIQKDDLDDQPTISSDTIVSASKDTRLIKNHMDEDELAFISPILDTLTIKKIMKDIHIPDDLIIGEGLLVEGIKKAILKLNTFKEDAYYPSIPEVIEAEMHNPSINIFKIVEVDGVSLNANTSLEVSRFNTKIKRDIKTTDDAYIASSTIEDATIKGKFTFTNMNEEPYISSNEIASGSKQTKLLTNISYEDTIYNKSIITVEAEKKSNINKITATQEDSYISSGTIINATTRNDFLLKHSEVMDSSYITSNNIIDITKENLAVKKNKFLEESVILTDTEITVVKHDPRYNLASVKEDDGPYVMSDMMLYGERKSTVKSITYVDLDPTISADFIISCSKYTSLVIAVAQQMEVTYLSDFIYDVEKYTKVPMFPYLIDNSASPCLLSDTILYGVKKSHLLKEPEDFNDLVINDIISLSADTKSHLLKIDSTIIDPTVVSNTIDNVAIKSHLLNIDSTDIDPTVTSGIILTGEKRIIYNTNSSLEEAYIASNEITSSEITDKFNYNSQLEEPYISSDVILSSEKQIP